jgi:PKD repeat protein
LLWYLGTNSNIIYLNNFINNNDNVRSSYSTNIWIWNSTSPITYTYNGNTYTNYLGNYWDDYTGSDADGDGIGETPYNIDSDADKYPLMEPFENYLQHPENLPPNPPTNLKQLKSDRTTVISVGDTTDERTVVFKGRVSDPDGDRVRLQVELRNLKEYGGQFDETKGGLKNSDLVTNGSEAVASAIELIDEDYHWRARAVDEHGEKSAWVQFGNNDVDEADFTVNTESAKPSANASGPYYGNYYGNVKEPIQFRGNGTAAKGRTIVAYEWTFHDGDKVEKKKEQNPTYTWSTFGPHLAELTVWDSAGVPSEPKKADVFVIEPFTFVQITDPHIGAIDYFNPYLNPPSPYVTGLYVSFPEIGFLRFSNALVEIKEINPDFVLISGDVADCADKDHYKKLYDAIKDQEFEVYIVPGNHDWYWDPANKYFVGLESYHEYIKPEEQFAGYTELIKPDNYTFEHKGYLFIGLDSGWSISMEDEISWEDWIILALHPTPEGSGLSKDQISALDGINSNLPKVIFMHHPAINDGDDGDLKDEAPGGNDACIGNNRAEFIKYCANHDNKVQLVLTGHTHQDKIFTAEGELLDLSNWIWGGQISRPIVLPFDQRPLFIQTASCSLVPNWPFSVFRRIRVDKFGVHPYESDHAPKPYELITTMTYCPVNSHAYDSKGRHTGINSTSGETERNIPDSFYYSGYDIPGNDSLNLTSYHIPETILLYNTTDTYRFEIVANLTEAQKATLNNTFNFTLNQQTDTLLVSVSYLNVSINESTTASVSVSPINPIKTQLTATSQNYAMEIDLDGNGEIDLVKDPDLVITDYAPNATIISPLNNSVHLFGNEILFYGTGTDLEDGILTNSSLVWSSRINGVIGVGNQFNTTNLSAGSHLIELMVNDSIGQIGLDNITLTVIAPDLAIDTLDISFSNFSPVEGDTITNNATVHNIGTANASNITVQFFDGEPLNAPQIGSNQTIASLSAGENQTVSVVWNTTGEAGDNSIWVSIDPSDAIQEPDNENNLANRSIFVDASNLLHILQAQTDRAVYLRNEEVLITCIVQNASGNISANVSAAIETPSGSMDILTLMEGPIGNYNGTFLNTSLSGTYNITIDANRIGFIGDNESLSFEILDTTPPASITNISNTTGSTWINWTWDNPSDPDFDYTLIYLNGKWKTATSKNYYLAEELNESTEYEIETRTVDRKGNINKTWVNQTAETTENDSPFANFLYTPENPLVNQTITFNASSSYDPDGDITLYDWDFGDGNTTNTTAQIITHSYSLPNNYTVTLTVTDDDGAKNSTSKVIGVQLPGLCGDVNGDGNVDFLGDVIGVARHYMYGDPINCTWCADVDCDGDIDFLGDAIKIARHYMYGEPLTCCSS